MTRCHKTKHKRLTLSYLGFYGLLNTRWTSGEGGGGRILPPPNLLGFYTRSTKFSI